MTDQRQRGFHFALSDAIALLTLVCAFAAIAHVSDYHLGIVLVLALVSASIMALFLRRTQYWPVWSGTVAGLCVGVVWCMTLSPFADYPKIDKPSGYSQSLAIFAVIGALIGFGVLAVRRERQPSSSVIDEPGTDGSLQYRTYSAAVPKDVDDEIDR